MRKLSCILLTLLTVLTIVLGGILPLLAGMLQDRAMVGKVSYEEMGEASLEIRELPMLDKLAILAKAPMISISEDKANLTQDQLPQIVGRELKPYVDCGLIDVQADFSDWENMNVSYEPSISYWEWEDTDESVVFWFITIVVDLEGDQNGEAFLRLTLDDQTGKLVTLEYNRSERNDEQKEEKSLIFFERYLNSLELTDSKDVTTNTYGPETLEDGGVYTTFQWTDEVYGTTSMYFQITSFGFFNYLGK